MMLEVCDLDRPTSAPAPACVSPRPPSRSAIVGGYAIGHDRRMHRRSLEAVHRALHKGDHMMTAKAFEGRRMKLLYSGASMCDEATLKRLFLIGDELSFIDRPPVILAGVPIGEGPLRRANFEERVNFKGAAVKVHIRAPPGPAEALYGAYALADFDNQEFARIVREGLTRDPAFARKSFRSRWITEGGLPAGRSWTR